MRRRRREDLQARHAAICAKGGAKWTEADIDELCRIELELSKTEGSKRSRLAEQALREARERWPGYLGTDSSGTWIEEQNNVNRAIARKKRAGQPGNPDRDLKMAKEFEKRWPKVKGRLSRSALKEIIGREYGLKRTAAINAIDWGLAAAHTLRILPDGSLTDGTTIIPPYRPWRRPDR